MPEAKTQMSAEEAVKLFSKLEIKVTTVKTVKGEMVRDPETKRYVTEEKPLAAAHIIGVNETADEVRITTIDGRKYSAKK